MYLFKTYLEPKQKMKRQLKKIYGLSNFYINKLYNQFGFNQQIFIKDLTSTQKKLLKDWFRTQFLTVNAKTQKKFKLGINTILKNKKWKKTKV